MRRRALPIAVLTALALTLVGATTAPAPDRLPAVALGAVLIWRVEIAAVLYAAAYGVIITARLALHGETLTRVGRDGIEVPRVGAERPEANAAEERFAAAIASLQKTLGPLANDRDDPMPLVLRDDEQET